MFSEPNRFPQIGGDEEDDISEDESESEENDLYFSDEDEDIEDEKQIFNKKTEKEDDGEDDVEDEVEVEDDDEMDYGDEDNFQKIDAAMREDYVASFHPQLKIPSYEEIRRLSVIRRNANGMIDDPLHLTLPFVSKYERTRIIGDRAAQLGKKAEPLIPVDENMTEYDIAKEEFNRKLLPVIICRPFPNGGGEYWKLSDLEII